MIPEAAVEAAAREFYGDAFDEAFGDYLQHIREKMRELLEAAAPHMLSEQAEAKHPKHQCEPWQIQVNGSETFRYCAACGEPQS